MSAFKVVLAIALLVGVASALPFNQSPKFLEMTARRTPQDWASLVIKGLHEGYPIVKKETGEAKRQFHPKNHGCVTGTITVDDKIDPKFNHGVFKHAASKPGKSLPAAIRFSLGLGTDDWGVDGKQIRGLALKIDATGMKGERNYRDDKGHDQDFLFGTGINFIFPDFERAGAGISTAVSKSTKTKLASLGAFIGAAIQSAGFKVFGSIIDIKKNIDAGNVGGAHPHPFQSVYHSQVAFGLGGKPVRYKAEHCKNIGKGKKLSVGATGPDRLKQNLLKDLATNKEALCMQFSVMPKPASIDMENYFADWEAAGGKWTPLFKFQAESEYDGQKCNKASFNPWTGFKAHEPLTKVNQIRKHVYAASANLRTKLNGLTGFECPFANGRKQFYPPTK